MLFVEGEKTGDLMTDKPINLAAFNLIGRSAESGLHDIEGTDLRSVLYARFRDLNKLRYDYPVVLDDYDDPGVFARSLTDIVNTVLQKLAPEGGEGAYMRSQILNLEREIRELAGDGSGISMPKAWDKAVKKIRARTPKNERATLGDCLEKIRDGLRIDGQVIGCNHTTPMAMLRQAWSIDQREKAHVSRKRVDELILKLENVLGAETKKSEQTLLPENLKGSVGSSFESAFDFDAMSELLAPATPRDPLPDDRRQRIRSLLDVLKSQRFFKSAKWSDKKGRRVGPYSFLFKNAASALKALRKRLPEMVELTKAISIAELEIANHYEASKHDRFFASFDEASLLDDDIAMFPTPLVGLEDGHQDAAEKSRILELLSIGLPVKILAQTDDILSGLAGSEGQLPFGGVSWQLANLAVGLNNVFVLQSGGAALYKMRDKIWQGLTYPGPALFSVFSGDHGDDNALPPYLVSAAATESRAFPTFSYNPASGEDWASRLSIDGNPQLERDWPVHDFSYEDSTQQRMSEDVIFTFVEFVVGDRRFSRYFASVPKEEWTPSMASIGRYLGASENERSNLVPYVLMVDENNMLHKLVVDDRLIRAALRCRNVWHSLQEMGGVHNSHALRLLKSERDRWQADKELELADLARRAEPDVKVAVVEEKVIVAEPETAGTPEEDEPSSGEPFIETVRCTTCNECTDINAQLFAYNDNKQAYIGDPSAGTYRQLVEAAENCQVSIIHPGEPKDLSEPNLDELRERAAVFN
jgi:hypothetical protein